MWHEVMLVAARSSVSRFGLALVTMLGLRFWCWSRQHSGFKPMVSDAMVDRIGSS
jgi:hypothetical protein